MERILSIEDMRSADAYTVEKLGVSRETLIERAGIVLAEEIKNRLHGGRVLFCLGKGTNGEDGRVAARLLTKVHGFTVYTLNVSNGIFKMLDKPFDIIVDCIFGTGLNKNVDGKYKQAIEKINNSGAYVVSCDIPSGLSGDTGRVMGIAVKANLTIAIQEYKLGHFLNDGPIYSGEVVARDIGISIWGDKYAQKMTDKDVLPFFKEPAGKINKGDLKRTAIIGGSKKYSGSAILSISALTAMKMGNGYSYIAVPECLFGVCVGLNPECVLTAIKDDGEYMTFDKKTIDELMKTDAIAIGMGMGVNENTYNIISYILKNYSGRLVIDADGLNSIAEYGLDILKEKNCSVVITPHIGEFSRLTGKPKETVLEKSIPLSMEFAKEYSVTVLLKNAVSIITDGEKVLINATGNNGMAKAGSGDVLTGVVLGMLTRNESLLDCTAGASYIFGKSGDIAIKGENVFTLTPTDVVKALPKAINSL